MVSEHMLSDFLSETDPYIQQLDTLSWNTAQELYEMLDTASQTVTDYIKEIDPKLRAELCTQQDKLLDRIADLLPDSLEDSLALDKELGVYTPAIQGYRKWSNTELMKDKGLTGYLLAQVCGILPTMYFCTNSDEYPYLKDLPNLALLFNNSENAVAAKKDYYDHLNENYKKMDVLILHGMYRQTLEFLAAYRKLRPDGIVYCGLDLNKYWMKQFDWKNPLIQNFANQCDIIATSCTSMRDALNLNPDANFPCRYLPNGFYNPANIPVVADSNTKENIILTVGRIGTEQKNNEEILIAFAAVSEALKDWKLRLIGPIESEFEDVINEHFKSRPDLKSRITFTGPITNKNELYNEYAKAKVFALTSIYEGGSPNVYAEALFHGCMFVTSDIDAASDITSDGSLGVSYKTGDFEALANALVKICTQADKNKIKEHIPKALAYGNKCFDWKRNAKKLAYMLFR